jgi:hypothetical protein
MKRNEMEDKKETVATTLEALDLMVPERHTTALTDDDLNLFHVYGDGQYARTGTMIAGSVIIGHIHKYSCINVMSTGAMILHMDGKTELYEAPCTFYSKAGSRKVLLILEDVTFTNIHKTDLADLKELRKELLIVEEKLPDLSFAKESIIEYFNKNILGESKCGQ